VIKQQLFKNNGISYEILHLIAISNSQTEMPLIIARAARKEFTQFIQSPAPVSSSIAISVMHLPGFHLYNNLV